MSFQGLEGRKSEKGYTRDNTSPAQEFEKKCKDKVLEEATEARLEALQPHLAPDIERPGPAMTGQMKIDLDNYFNRHIYF